MATGLTNQYMYRADSTVKLTYNMARSVVKCWDCSFSEGQAELDPELASWIAKEYPKLKEEFKYLPWERTMSDKLAEDIKEIITKNGNSIKPSKLIQSLIGKKYSEKEIQSVIHDQIDLGEIELGTGLNVVMPR